MGKYIFSLFFLKKKKKKYIYIYIYIYIFPGFNNHSIGEGVFPEYTEMVESPVKVSKNTLLVSYICLSSLGI